MKDRMCSESDDSFETTCHGTKRNELDLGDAYMQMVLEVVLQ